MCLGTWIHAHLYLIYQKQERWIEKCNQWTQKCRCSSYYIREKDKKDLWWEKNVGGQKGVNIKNILSMKRNFFLEDRPSVEIAWRFHESQDILQALI